MVTFLLELLRYGLTLLFGVAVSAIFLKLQPTKRSIATLLVFSVIILLVQGLLYQYAELTFVTAAYPLITHLPLWLLFVLVLHQRPLPALIAITTAYLCCQISNWGALVTEALGAPSWAADLAYSLILAVVLVLVLRFIAEPISSLLTKQQGSLIPFAIVPLFYYGFDYCSTVYTELFYSGNRVVVEFIPLLLCIFYLLFCAVYFRQYEEKQAIENRSRLMQLQQEYTQKEISILQQNEKSLALVRHDMRHFLNTIAEHIENGRSEEALQYIGAVTAKLETGTGKKYSANKAVNMILSCFEETITEHGIQLQTSLTVCESLPISDVDLTAILSNALENAIHAVLLLPQPQRILSLRMTEKSGKLLISLENPVASPPRFVDGMPQAEHNSHGLGTQSIRCTVEKLHGTCRFSATETHFLLQIII